MLAALHLRRRWERIHVCEIAGELALIHTAKGQDTVGDFELGRGLERDTNKVGVNGTLSERVVEDGRNCVTARCGAFGQVHGANAAA